MELSRRDGLIAALGLATTTATAAFAKKAKIVLMQPGSGSLNALAKAKGMRFGSTVNSGNSTSGSYRNPEYAKLLESECGILVPENEMKWQAIRPGPSQFDFAAFDAQIAYAEAKGLAMRGHTLLWHRPQWMPAWLEAYDFGSSPGKEASRLLTAHISTVCGRYKGKIKSFDVCNETVMPEDGSLASTAISRAMGGTLPLVDLAFHTAREHAPAAQLVYNDYMSWEPGNEIHRNGVLKLLEGFKKRGVPVDALGIQSHIRIDSYNPATRNGPHDERAWRKFLDEVTGMGYTLLVTEFDVNDQALPADIAWRDRSVADYAKGYLDLMFSYKQLKDVLVWGMCDPYSWLQKFEPLRTDGLAKRCCPYDAGFAKKPLYDAIAAAFASAPMR
jgi:endo-1,4-beta-xylanase